MFVTGRQLDAPLITIPRKQKNARLRLGHLEHVGRGAARLPQAEALLLTMLLLGLAVLLLRRTLAVDGSPLLSPRFQ